MKKYLTKVAKGGGGKVVYHTENCHYIQLSDKVQEADEYELEWHDAVECGKCQNKRRERLRKVFTFWEQMG